MPTQTWAIRSLIALLVVGPLGLLAYVLTFSPPAPKLETDIHKVFARLPEECNYDRIDKWCGLFVVEAKPREAARIHEAVEAGRYTEDVWCCPTMSSRPHEQPRSVPIQKDIKWYRLIDPVDQRQWIGIGVRDHHNTGWTAHWIMCRVAVGFKPSNE